MPQMMHVTAPTADARTKPASWWFPRAACPLLSASIGLTALGSLFAVAYPDVDIAIARLFYVTGDGFVAAHDRGLLFVRAMGRVLPTIAIAWITGLLVVRLVQGKALPWFSDRALVFVASVFAIGPGLIVNTLFKSHWGRPRPLETDLFGGAHPFVSAWVPGGGCTHNCSFVSGEAAAATAMLAFALILPSRFRAAAVTAVLAWTIIIGANRVAFGAHYASDVTLGALMSLTITLALSRLILRDTGRPLHALTDLIKSAALRTHIEIRNICDGRQG
ncbi:MAG: phosphatase PAP2 family protein [Hyphomicrobium sp.]